LNLNYISKAVMIVAYHLSCIGDYNAEDLVEIEQAMLLQLVFNELDIHLPKAYLPTNVSKGIACRILT
jgi:hypothetical protein